MFHGPRDPGARAIEELQAHLIGDLYGVPASDVTIEFVSDILEKRIYPKARFDRNSEYGGYSNETLKVLTGEEVEKFRLLAEEVPEELRPVAVAR